MMDTGASRKKKASPVRLGSPTPSLSASSGRSRSRRRVGTSGRESATANISSPAVASPRRSPEPSPSAAGQDSDPFVDVDISGARAKAWIDAIVEALSLSSCEPISQLEEDRPTSSTAPQTDQQIANFLASIWDNATVRLKLPKQWAPLGNHRYLERIVAIRATYNAKVIELASSELHYIQQYILPMLHGSSGRVADLLTVSMVRAGLVERFKAIRRALNRLTMRAVQAVEARSQVQSGSAAGRRRSLGAADVPPLCSQVLEGWFQAHLPFPYPSFLEKKRLAEACHITPSWVSAWFSKRRFRDNNFDKGNKDKGKRPKSKSKRN